MEWITEHVPLAVQWLGWALFLGTAVVKFVVWVAARPAWAETRLSRWLEEKKSREHLTKLMENIAKEFRPNGGSTFRDALDDIKTSVGRIESQQQRDAKKNDDAAGQLQAFMSISDRALWKTDDKGLFTWANPAYLDLVGRTLEELKGTNWKNTIHHDDLSQVVSRWEDVVRDKRTQDSQFRIVKEDGSVITVKSHGAPYTDSNGNVMAWFGSCDLVAAPVVQVGSSKLMRVLWVDDGKDDLEMISHYATASEPGIEVSTTPTPGDGIQQFTSALAVGRGFDVVILDYMMPGMDGMDVARAIRKHERNYGGSKHVRIAFCTGAKEDISERDKRDVDATRVFPKPYSPCDVFGWIKGAIG